MHEDLIYEELPENPNDIDKIDIFLKVLLNDSPNYVQYHKMGIDNNKEELFNVKLNETGFVIAMSNQNTYNPLYKLSSAGHLALEKFGSYKNYITALEQEEHNNAQKLAKDISEKEERHNLEMQKLRSENIKLTNELIDYGKVKSQRNILFYISIISLIVAIVTLISRCSGQPGHQ